jgi:iron complex transport system substrate-binding protein
MLRVTRRHQLGAALLLPLLAACGPADSGSGTSTGPQGAGAAPGKRTVDTPRGLVEVPARPQRVVVFDRRGTLGYLLDLGIKPVAAMTAPQIYGGKLFHPLLDPDISGIATLSSTEPDLEQVAGLRPDLIVGYTADAAMEKGYRQLSGIAPTVAAPIDFNNPEDELTFLGQVFGMEARAAALREGFRGEVATARSRARNPGSVSIVLPVVNGVRIYSPGNLAGQIVQGLGGSVVPDIKGLNPDAAGLLALISDEQVGVIDGETILLLVNLAPELRTDTNRFLTSPLVQGLPATRANRLVEIESQANFGTAGLRGQRQILEQLTRLFA